MRLAAYFTGTFFLSLTILGLLFKLMHWPGAGIGTVVGVAGLAFLAIPIGAIYRYKRGQAK